MINKKLTLVLGLLLINLAVHCAPVIDPLVSAVYTSENDYNSYNYVKKSFKKDLNAAQAGLMETDKYLDFIEPQIEKAEKELTVIQNLKSKKTIDQNDKRYMLALLRLNVATFHKHLNPKRAESYYNDCVEQLRNSIKNLNGTTIDNIDNEIQKTTELLTKTNQEFYKKLSLTKKIYLALAL